MLWLCFNVCEGSWDTEGQMDGLHVLGNVIYTCLLLALNFKFALEISTWTVPNVVMYWIGSVFFYISFLCLYDRALPFSPDFYFTVTNMINRPVFWFTLVLTPIACVIWDMALYYLRMTYFPK